MLPPASTSTISSARAFSGLNRRRRTSSTRRVAFGSAPTLSDAFEGAILTTSVSLDWAPRMPARRAREIEAAYGKLERRARTLRVSRYRRLLHSSPSRLAELPDLTFEITRSGSRASAPPTSDDRFPRARADLLDMVGTRSRKRALCRVRAVPSCAPDSRKPSTSSVTKSALGNFVSTNVDETLTMKEIGSILGVNESRVSQLHTRADPEAPNLLVSLAA
jgi:hypothetical protein